MIGLIIVIYDITLIMIIFYMLLVRDFSLYQLMLSNINIYKVTGFFMYSFYIFFAFFYFSKRGRRDFQSLFYNCNSLSCGADITCVSLISWTANCNHGHTRRTTDKETFFPMCVANYRRVFYHWKRRDTINVIYYQQSHLNEVVGGLGWNLRLRCGIRNFRVIWRAFEIERSREIRYSFLGIAN